MFLSCQLISELLKWIIAISLFSQSWKTQKLHYHLNYLQMKGKMPSFLWQNSKRCNGDRISTASLRSLHVPPVSAGPLRHWRQSMRAMHKHEHAVPGQGSHYIFYFTIVVPDFQQHMLCLNRVVIEYSVCCVGKKKSVHLPFPLPKKNALQYFFFLAWIPTEIRRVLSSLSLHMYNKSLCVRTCVHTYVHVHTCMLCKRRKKNKQ